MASTLLTAASAFALGNADGLARQPPMGWRNWNYFRGHINQNIMVAQMSAMANRSRFVVGPNRTMSLIDLGYVHAGLDDNWQHCHAGIHGPGSDDLPRSFHNASGWPLINTSSFPDMKSMVDFGHSLGLKVGWYDNNCICGEGSSRLTPEEVDLDVHGNVKYILATGFDGLKADGCGPGRNMTELADLLNSTGRPVLIENCHYNKVANGAPLPKGAMPDSKGRIFPYWQDGVPGGTLVCPEHTFRASGDIANSWHSWFGNLASLQVYQDPVHPISQPGCWAYADMLMVGVGATAFAPNDGPAATFEEWRSHFGAWAINSSPLILSFDLANITTMDIVWPFISNVEAIDVNQQWAGHPGRQIEFNDPIHVWSKNLTNESLAVLLINMDQSPANYSLDLSTLGQPLNVPVRDIWNHKAIFPTAGKINISLLSTHDSVFLRFGD